MDTKKKSFFFISATFIVGLILGFMIHVMLMNNRIERFNEIAKPGGLSNYMIRRLDLTQNQKQKLKPTFEKFKMESDEIRYLIHSKMDSLMQELKSEIKPVLTEEQYEEFLRLSKRPQHFPPKRMGHRRRGRF